MTHCSLSNLADLNRLLKEVSRSFYLSIRILPHRVRPQISLTYILARATDTVADTRSAPAALRHAALLGMRAQITAAAEGEEAQAPDFRNLSERMPPAGCALLESFPDALAMLRRCGAGDRRRIGDVLCAITGGQEMDVSRFGDATIDNIAALETDEELDDYTYRVAGCVGEFWTKMCRAHLFPRANVTDASLFEHGVRFGKGLQLVNILRDLPADLRQGRCYIPRERLSKQGLSPELLLDPASMRGFRPLYAHYLDEAEGCLAAGHAYVNALPRSQLRVRMACTLPMMIGAETLTRLRSANVLDDRNTIKVSRPDIRRMIIASLFHCLRLSRSGLSDRTV